MSKTALIFGGSGKVARALTPLLTSSASNPWKVYSIIRNSSQSASLEALGAEPIVQSIEDSSVSDFAATIKKTSPDVVIWSAGAGGGSPERTKAVDNEGAIKSMDACVEAGVKRYVIVSAIDVRDKSLEAPNWYNESDRQLSERVWSAIGPYMQAKFIADKELASGNEKRKLDYTIIRPGRLTEDEPKGTISAGHVHMGEGISRADVAQTIVDVIKNDGTIGMAIDIVGGDTVIKQAIEQAVAAKADSFKGYY